MKRPRRPWTAQDDAHLRQFHSEGKIDRDIAYILSRPHSVIFRYRKAAGLKPNGKPGTPKGAHKHSDEVKAKIRAAQLKRWQTDEEYRRLTLAKLQRGRETNQAKRWHVPLDPDDRRYYFKVRRDFGAKYAQKAVGEIMSAKASPAE